MFPNLVLSLFTLLAAAAMGKAGNILDYKMALQWLGLNQALWEDRSPH